MEKHNNLKGKIELDELLLKVKNGNKAFINNLEEEEESERAETVDSLINQIKGDKKNTNTHKLKFINEIKNELGSDIKTKKGVTFKKVTLKDKLINFFKLIYTKF